MWLLLAKGGVLMWLHCRGERVLALGALENGLAVRLAGRPTARVVAACSGCGLGRALSVSSDEMSSSICD